MSNLVARVFLDSDLRCGHVGLAKLAREARPAVDVEKLKPREHCLFVNRAADKLKLYSGNGVVSYLMLSGGRRFDMTVITDMVETFGSNKVSLKKSYRTALKNRFESKYGRPFVPPKSKARPAATVHKE